MKLLSKILFFIFILNCNRGPAEDRGKENCENFLLTALLLNSQPVNTNRNLLMLSLYKYRCEENNDSTINRYYRGYVLNKE